MLSLIARSVISPATGIALARVGWRFRSRDWYRRAPFLPLPDRTYVRWRMHTAYGRDDAVPSADDIVRYARWATQD
jgi:hypothetical protein